MKQLYILFLLITTIGFSQIPNNYYDSAIGSGYTLKTQLYNIINGHTDNGYGGLYVTYEASDIDSYFEMNGTLLDMYSENPNGADSYEYTYGSAQQDNGTGGTFEGDKFNREHIIPQSVFNSATPMRSDAHFVVPSDKYVNAQRGSFPFGVVDSPNWTSTNGSKRGNNLNSGYSAGYTNTVFEPIDEFKGDIARMFFYFATRYEDNVAGWSYTMFNGTSDQVFDLTFFNILYQWHIDDPVSTRETDRNDAIYTRQNNRNPFIDHPEYVASIWSNLLSTEENYLLKSVVIYPNPLKDNNLNIKTKTPLRIEIFNVLGKRVLTSKVDTYNKTVNVSSLNKGIYLIKLKSEQGTTTKKLIKQ